MISSGINITFAAIADVRQYLGATVLVRLGGDWVVAFLLSGIFGVALGVVNALLIRQSLASRHGPDNEERFSAAHDEVGQLGFGRLVG